MRWVGFSRGRLPTVPRLDAMAALCEAALRADGTAPPVRWQREPGLPARQESKARHRESFGMLPTVVRAFSVWAGGRRKGIWEMARARMLNRDLAASERFWDCSPDARTAYMIAMPFTDRDGFLPAPPRKMLGLFLGMSGWSLGHVEEIRDELIAAGLWENGPLDSVRVVRFHEFQPGCTPGTKRYGQEAASKYVSGDPRSTPAEPPQTASQDKISKGKSSEVTNPHTATKGEIVRAYREAYEAELKRPCTLRPKDPRAAEDAADLGTFPAGRDLVAPFRATIRRFADEGYTISLKSIVNNAELDPVPKKKAPPRGEVEYPSLAGLADQIRGDYDPVAEIENKARGIRDGAA